MDVRWGAGPKSGVLPAALPAVLERGTCNRFEAWRTFILLIFLFPSNIYFLNVEILLLIWIFFPLLITKL